MHFHALYEHTYPLTHTHTILLLTCQKCITNSYRYQEIHLALWVATHIVKYKGKKRYAKDNMRTML